MTLADLQVGQDAVLRAIGGKGERSGSDVDDGTVAVHRQQTVNRQAEVRRAVVTQRTVIQGERRNSGVRIERHEVTAVDLHRIGGPRNGAAVPDARIAPVATSEWRTSRGAGRINSQKQEND